MGKSAEGMGTKSMQEVLRDGAVRFVRGPLYATIATLLLSPLYFRIVASWQWGEHALFAVGTICVHEVLYFGMNGTTMLLDRFGIMEQYKIVRAKGQVPKDDLVRKTIREALIGQLLVQPFTAWLVFDVFRAFGMPSLDASLPNPVEMWFQFLICALVKEVGSYWVHRLFHDSKYMYQRFHKQHHEYTGTIGFAAEYAHPVEQFLADQLPMVAGAMFLGAHTLIWWVWLAWRLEETYEAHSGYCFDDFFITKFGFLHPDAALFHDYHHSKNMGNYGSELLDRLSGTCDEWLAHCDATRRPNGVMSNGDHHTDKSDKAD